MRYNVYSPCAFHSRIAKSLGVLVGAALVATLMLPTAAQAQTPDAPDVEGMGAGTTTDKVGSITATWGQPLGGSGDDDVQDGWMLEHTEPGVAWDDATMTPFMGNTTMTSGELPADDPRIHHGVWRFRVSYWNHDAKDKDDVLIMDGEIAGERVGSPSALTDYLHGPPASAPTGFAAYPAGPDARRLVWDKVTGADSYELRYTDDATDDDAWTDWDDKAMSGMVVDDLEMGTEYTFEVRALGATRAGVGDLHGPSASTMEAIPVPTPTLPEIAALFLAMLLLGSGAYLLRRRQSGGLTPA